MNEQQLFHMRPDDPHVEIFLGEYPCDIPFGGGELEKVAVSLTTDSAKSQHGIPVLRLHAGHQMDFASHEQTPAGHAAKLVADWLNTHNVDDRERYAAELFLWQWPGIRQDDNNRWHLCNREERRTRFEGMMLDCAGNLVVRDAAASDLPGEQIIDSGNLQVQPLGFCCKASPCYLLDACLLCSDFISNIHFLPALKQRLPELQQRRNEAAAANNHRVAESSHQAVQNLEMLIATLETLQINKAVSNG